MSPAKKKSARSKQAPSLEEALAELEGLVASMEEGDLSLEDALAQFQRGIELTRICRSSLKDAEQKVQILQKKAGIENLVDFENTD